jgi:hypothetical protein
MKYITLGIDCTVSSVENKYKLLGVQNVSKIKQKFPHIQKFLYEVNFVKMKKFDSS